MLLCADVDKLFLGFLYTYNLYTVSWDGKREFLLRFHGAIVVMLSS